MATTDPDASRWYDRPGSIGPTVITYSFSHVPDFENGFDRPMTSGNEKKPVKAAFKVWEQVLDVKFKVVSAWSDADIEIGWNYIDDRLGTLGRTYLTQGPRGLEHAVIQFDRQEEWRMEHDFVESKRPWEVNFFMTAVHEIGHAIGVDHIDNVRAVMAPLANRETLALTADDVRAAVALYGPSRESAGPGRDVLVGTSGDDLLRGGAGRDKLYGDAGDDELIGGRHGDLLQGRFGDDRLVGQHGRDDLRGGFGADLLIGGKGRDLLEGGAGRDVFLMTPGGGRDVVSDFKDGRDLIRVQAAEGFDELVLRQKGGDVMVRHEDARMILLDTELSALSADDFLF